MKVLVIGATGDTGANAVDILKARGDEVTAFVRSGKTILEGVRLAIGEARDAKSLEDAVAGQDAVFSAFGPRSMKKDDIQEVFMKNLVGAMKSKGVKRLSNLSAWGVGDTRNYLPLVGKIFRALVVKDLFTDKEAGEVHLFASGLDWINVRPSRLAAGRGKPRGMPVKASLDPKGLKTWPFMTRADLAQFMVEQLTDDTWVRKSPLLGY